MTLTYDEVMAALGAAGTEQTRKTYLRHGASEPLFGVKFGDLRPLAKKIGTDHALAEALWRSGNTDARLLACMVADPEQVSEAELRKLSLAGGLMARVAYADDEVHQSEFDTITKAIQDYWQLPAGHANLVAEIAVSEISKGMDYYRLAREFFLVTSAEERRSFIEVLFVIAAGHEDVSFDETEEIRSIANLLKLTHREFIDAKLRAKGETR